MRNRIVMLLLAASLAGCGLLPEQIDETRGWSAAKLYAAAMDSMNDKDYTQAIKYLEKLESRYPYGVYAQQAQMEVAYAYYKSSEPASAIAAADRFIKLHPDNPHVDYLYYLKGLVNFNDNSGFFASISDQDMSERDPKAARESFDAFKTLVDRFPDSKYREDAIARMSYLVNSLADHEVNVARYYYNRGAYLAAANRAQDAIKDYPGTPARERALALMMYSYKKLGLTDLKNDAERVLKLNFPKSIYLTSDSFEAKRAWWQFF